MNVIVVVVKYVFDMHLNDHKKYGHTVGKIMIDRAILTHLKYCNTFFIHKMLFELFYIVDLIKEIYFYGYSMYFYGKFPWAVHLMNGLTRKKLENFIAVVIMHCSV